MADLRSYNKAAEGLADLQFPLANIDIYISGVYGSTCIDSLLSKEDMAKIKAVVVERLQSIVEEGVT